MIYPNTTEGKKELDKWMVVNKDGDYFHIKAYTLDYHIESGVCTFYDAEGLIVAIFNGMIECIKEIE